MDVALRADRALPRAAGDRDRRDDAAGEPEVTLADARLRAGDRDRRDDTAGDPEVMLADARLDAGVYKSTANRVVDVDRGVPPPGFGEGGGGGRAGSGGGGGGGASAGAFFRRPAIRFAPFGRGFGGSPRLSVRVHDCFDSVFLRYSDRALSRASGGGARAFQPSMGWSSPRSDAAHAASCTRWVLTLAR